MFIKREKSYGDHVIQVVSFNGALSHFKRNKKWGQWYPSYRIWKEGKPRELVYKDTLDHPYDKQEEADKTAFRAAEAWIDAQEKKA